LDGSGNPMDTAPQAWNSSIFPDIKLIPFNPGGDDLMNINNAGEYMLKFEAINACGASDTKIGYFEVTPPNFPNIPITINGSAPSTGAPISFNIYSCSTEVALLDDNNWNAHSYKVTLTSVNSSGGSELVVATTNWENNFSSIEDLKNLPATNGNWLTDSDNAGYFKVTLEVGHDCNSDGVRDVEDEYDGYFFLSTTPDPISMDLKVKDTTSSATICYSQDESNMCSSPRATISWKAGTGTYGNYNIEQFKRKIEEVDCVNGHVTDSIYEDTTPINVSSGQQPLDYLNAININGAPGYFDDTNKIGKCYKLTITVLNECGSATDWSYFKLDSNIQYRKKYIKTNISKNEISFYPNPVRNQLNFIIVQDADFSFSAELLDISGRLVKLSFSNCISIVAFL
jgi:hypothetical protein